MDKKFKMSDEARFLEDKGYLVTNSWRTVTIWMRHVETGEVCSKVLPQDYWEQEYSRRSFEIAREEEGFELAEVPNFPFFGMGTVGPDKIALVTQ